MSPALPCHLDPVPPPFSVWCLPSAPSLHCTSTRAPKHIRREGILCPSSAAAQDWSIDVRLRYLLASSATCHSLKAKAAPPRGPDLAEATND
ncbi:hypothetical protein CORC01_08826 [Colletotrichum orchidophilum]|uniref:Uncharacterized protein n=1 Tax=Colletotrichum orchidophilum TaxID=1209926 RepID=A0A1G4B330_9PEZI|nr:uncharacterized protein CORC01_08826 [Colletotrichum orchidophilum]OHE95829.1 hypothetical protein CORC01_08826 [Colletotrichum orchidophilum]